VASFLTGHDAVESSSVHPGRSGERRAALVEEGVGRAVKTLFELRDTVVPLVAVFLAYALGRRQGRAQTRYQESAKVVIELRRKMRDTMESFPYPLLERGQDPLDFLPTTPLYHWLRRRSTVQRLEEFVWLMLLGRRLRDLGGYYEANEPWLSPEIREKVGPVLKSIAEQTMILYTASGRYPRDWESLRRREEEFDLLLNELDAEARRLIGIPQERPWWRRVFG
jgi:hypothetical protein